MAAEVSSSLVRLVKEDGEGKGKRDLITRDLLGGCAVLGSKELDLDLQVPAGWERRLDLLSGKMYLEKRGSADPVHRQLHDLNLPPPAPWIGGATATLTEDSSALDLRLVAPSAASATSDYQSVCTLEKVKSALERAGLESRCKQQRARGSAEGSASPSSSTTSSSFKRRLGDDDEVGEGWDSPTTAPAMMAAGCPSCLLYVLISKGNPRCPRCDSHVPFPALQKKPRFDLNSSHSHHPH